jgi:uncharacterized protein (DUF433 family)
MIQPAFSPAEVAALLDLPERHVRKEIEHGLLSTGTPPRVEFQALVYFEALRMMDLDLGIDDRRKVLTTIRNALVHARPPETVELSSVLRLEIGSLVRDLRARVDAFSRWREKLVRSDDILGGEPVFPKSRLAVSRVAGLAERGESLRSILKDYPHLTEQDVAFARLFVRAYPRVGRPREQLQAPPR